MLSYKTLDNLYNPKENAIGFLRLILALMVVIQHGFVLNYQSDPLSKFGFLSFGSMGVNCFFILSGFLITASWFNSKSIFSFIIKRILRIFPAFWTCLLISAFIFSYLLGYLNHIQFSIDFLKNQLSYIYKNFLLIINQPEIFNLTSNHAEKSLNGSLWTLSWEFLCYMSLAIIGILGLFKKHILITALILLYIVTYWLSDCKCTIFLKYYTSERVTILPYMFGVGILFYLYLDKIPFSKLLALASIIIVIIDVKFNKSMPIYPFFLAYILLYLSIKLPFKSIEKYGDFSYGIYIYHFPIIQIMLLAFNFNLNSWTLILLSLIPTLILATFSWNFIEKPALKLKSLFNK